MRAAAILLLVVGLAAGAWFVLVGRDAGDGEGEAIDRPAAGEEAAGDLATLRGRGVEEVSQGAAAVASSPAGDADAEPTAEESLYVLRGELVGFDPTRAGEARVRVFSVHGGWAASGDAEAEGTADSEGRFRLDLTAFFGLNQELTHIEILVDHPAYVQGMVRVDVTKERDAGRGEIAARVTLRPGLAIAGQVVDEIGAGLSSVDVALFKSGPEGPVIGHTLPIAPLAREQTDPEGRYRLRVAEPGIYLVVATAERRRPAGANVTFTTGSELALAPLVLQPGATITGRVLCGGAPVVDAHVTASAPATGYLPLDAGDREVHWAPGPLLRADDWTESDEHGFFHLEGLNPVEHRVRVYSVSGVGFDDVCPLVTHDLILETEAPAVDVVLEIEGARLELCALSEGAPVAGATLRLRTPGTAFRGTTDAEGRLGVLLSPGLVYTILVEQEEYERTTLEVRAGAVGSRTLQEIVLRVAAPRPALRVTFTGPRAETLQETAFRLRALPDGDSHEHHHDVERVSGGVYRLKNLDPGRYVLVTTPGCGFWEESGYHLQERREVEVPVEGEGRVQIPLRLGGRICIAARNEAGVLLDASCTIRNAAGEEQDVMFSTQAESMTMSSSLSLGELSPATVGPPLTPGAYTIELSMGGYASRTLEVEVRPDETRQVDVILVSR